MQILFKCASRCSARFLSVTVTVLGVMRPRPKGKLLHRERRKHIFLRERFRVLPALPSPRAALPFPSSGTERAAQGRCGTEEWVVKGEVCSGGLCFSPGLASNDFFLLLDFLKTHYLEVILDFRQSCKNSTEHRVACIYTLPVWPLLLTCP